MLEKNISHSDVREIEFNWERVKKKAASRKEELISNTPRIQKREVNSSSQPINTPADMRERTQISTTSNTDTLMDPYIDITIETDKLSGTPSTHLTGTQQPKLLALARPGEEITPCGDGDNGPEQNAVELLKQIKAGTTTGRDMTIDERRLVVSSMRELGQTQDAIADLLKVSRRTVVSDYKYLRQQQALAIANTDTHDIAGEVYSVAKTCIRRALQAGHFKTVSVIMRDMVEVLQSLGVVYRAPKTSMQASLHGSLSGVNGGYHKYMEAIGEDKNKVIEVLDCMFNAIDNE